MNRFVLKGHICHTPTQGGLQINEAGYLLCENGVSQGIVKELPESWKEAKLTDYGDCLIIPGLVDLHTHAPQYSFRGLGLDLELLQWLDTHTFPEESKYKDLSYAKRAYTIFADDLKRSATTRACIFATIHRPATQILMDLMEQSGLKTMVGKVNMDRNSPDGLKEESAARAAEDTIQWLEESAGRYEHVSPILTPRFIPSCSDELMERLSAVRNQYHLPVQSHLSENPGEIEWVRELCPQAGFYGDAYDRFGLFGGTEEPAVMAHCVYSGAVEQQLLKDRGVWVAHCPQSNMNLSSGIAPVRTFLEQGIRVGLGSDIAGGCHASIFRAMTDAIQVSKLYWRLIDHEKMPLTFEDVFYLATKGGGSFFGQVGSFAKGDEMDAVVLDDSGLSHPQPLTTRQRLERVCYLADDRQIFAKYVAGKQVIW